MVGIGVKCADTAGSGVDGMISRLVLRDVGVGRECT